MPEEKSVSDTEVSDTEEEQQKAAIDDEAPIQLEKVKEETSPKKKSRAEGGFDGFISKTKEELENLDYEESIDSFLDKPIKVQNALRKQFPDVFPEDEYGSIEKEKDTLSDFDALYDKRRAAEKAQEGAEKETKEAIAFGNKILEDNPNFAIKRGKTFKTEIEKLVSSGNSYKQAIDSVISKMTLSGEFVPEKIQKEIKNEGKKESGQILSDSASKKQQSQENKYKSSLPDRFQY